MKNKLCILTYVFGKQYQDYIPLYIYSILRAYPEYFPIVFSELPIVEHVSKQLNILRELGEFKVSDSFNNMPNLKGQRAKSIRWLLECEEFFQYEAVYVGDIDIIVMNESPSLFEQHIVHCDIIGLPYSNLVRSAQKTHSLWKSFKENGLYGAIVAAFYHSYVDRKLTGLHFFKTVPYLEKLQPKISMYLERLRERSLRSLWRTKHHSNCFSNENFLYDIMVDSGMGVPPIVDDYGLNLLDYRNYEQVGFRPHHGIHLGVFRGTKPSKQDEKMLMLDFYLSYYSEFCILTKNDAIYKKISAHFSPFLKEIIDKMHNFYKDAL